MGEVLTISQLAQYLGRHRTTVWRWVRDGEFPPGVEIGGTRYWVRAAVHDHLVERQSVASSQEAV